MTAICTDCRHYRAGLPQIAFAGMRCVEIVPGKPKCARERPKHPVTGAFLPWLSCEDERRYRLGEWRFPLCGPEGEFFAPMPGRAAVKPPPPGDFAEMVERILEAEAA